MASPSIQSCNHTGTGPYTAAFGSNNTAKNTIVVTVWTATVPTVTVSDSQGNAYTLVVSALRSDNTGSAFIYVSENIKAGPNTITVTPLGGTDFVGFVGIEEPPSSGTPISNSNGVVGGTQAQATVSLSNTTVGDVCVALFLINGTVGVGNFGTNVGNSIFSPFSNILTQDGNSSGGTINATSSNLLGGTSGYTAIAVDLHAATTSSNAIFYNTD